MNAYQTAQSLGLTGTDAEIVAKLQTITAAPISLAYLMELLNFRGMLRKTDGQNGQERWVGTLPNLKAALVALNQTASVEAYEMWFSHVTNPRQVTWDTTKPEYSESFAAMKAAFADQASMPTSADFAAVVALGEGKPFAELTVEQYQAQTAAAQAESAKASLRNRLQEERERFDARSNICLGGINDGTITSGSGILAALELGGG
jgi:hypothetical protein